MPFYLRKQPFDIPPPTEKDWIKKDDEEDFFLNDPDELLDSLPQPFCMINKILKFLFERAWERIEGRHQLQETRKQSFTPFCSSFCFVKDNLLHIKSINEVEDISKRNTCVALELSHGSDYAGFLQGSSEVWLEIYRLPKDSWQKETEHLHTITPPGPGFVKEMGASQLSVQEKSMKTLFQRP